VRRRRKQTPIGGLKDGAETLRPTGLGSAQQASKRQNPLSRFLPFWATCAQVALLAPLVSENMEFGGLRVISYVKRFCINALTNGFSASVKQNIS
jgi:hypothetical protein